MHEMLLVPKRSMDFLMDFFFVYTLPSIEKGMYGSPFSPVKKKDEDLIYKI